jgi:glyoxylase-like metal-dependent hydrolase (beta-lactamase superfamily II)
MANFVYLLTDPESREGLVVDSGWETGPIVDAVRETRTRVKYVVATHEHFDHTSTIGEVASALGARTVAHENSPVDHDLSVSGGDELKLGKKGVKVFYTPGHTEDSICLYDGRNLFTGDTLFVGTIGKFRRESTREIYESLHKVIMRFPDSTVIYPGHDYGEVPYRTLGEEKAVNPFLVTGDFRSFMSIFA